MKKTRSNTFILENEKAWEPAGEGVVRQILGYDGQVMLVKVKFEQGAVGTLTPTITPKQPMWQAENSNSPLMAKSRLCRQVTAFTSNRMPNMDVLAWKPVYLSTASVP